MEDKIICEIKYGTLYQKVYVISNNNMEQYRMLLSEIPSFINKYDINDIYIKGNKGFSLQIESEVKNIQYNYNQVNKKIFHYIEGE